jgi:MFS family permease
MKEPRTPNRPEPAARLVRRNFVALAFDGIFFFFGLLLISYENILPVYLRGLGASGFAVALIPVAHTLGLNLPSAFVAHAVERLPRKRGYVLAVGLSQRIPWVVAALAAFLLAPRRPGGAIAVTLLALLIVSIGSGVNIPAFFHITAKTIPPHLRGRLFAVRGLGSVVAGLLSGGLVALILAATPFPHNYGLLFVAACVSFFVSLGFMARVVETTDDPPVPPLGLRDQLRAIARVLRTHHAFRIFVFGRVLYATGMVSTAFFAVHLLARHERPQTDLGLYTLLATLTFIAVFPLLGWLADRIGYRANFVIGSTALLLGNLLALLDTPYAVSLLVIVCGAAAQGVRNLSEYPMTMDFAPRERIPTYMGGSGLIVGPAALLALPLGALADAAGLHALFAVCAALAGATLLLFLFAVPEPRATAKRGIGSDPAGA